MKIKSIRHKGQGFIDVNPHAPKQEKEKKDAVQELLARMEKMEKELEVLKRG